MANGNGSANGLITSQKVLASLAGTGVLGVVAAGMLAVANDARIAISVAEQHGQELLLVRGEISSIRVEMVERTAVRYTSRDAAAHEKYVERRFNELEKKLDKLEADMKRIN
jgi:hypothetical protein